MSRTLIAIGLLLIVAGLLWPWLAKLPLGQLPGDIVIERERGTFYFPLTTMVLVSIILSFLLHLFSR